MEFNKLHLKDKQLFDKYLGQYKFYTYEYSFTALYLWRNYLNVEFAVNNDYIVIKKRHSEFGSYFIEPLGYKENELQNIVEELNKLRVSDNMDNLFRDVEKPFLDNLINIFGDRIEYFEDEDNFDYIYDTKDLATLIGGKLKKRRTRYNVFVKNHPNCYVKYINGCEIDYKIIQDCEKLSQYWYSHEEIKNEELYYEVSGIMDLFNNIKYLNLKAIAVYCDDKIIGFSIGENINDETALMYVEKCDKEYDGAYAYINKTFIQECFYDTKFINRGEDLGDLGLRQAKMGYRPIKLGRKYIVNLK